MSGESNKWSLITKKKQPIEDFKSWPDITGAIATVQVTPQACSQKKKDETFIQTQTREQILDGRTQRKDEKKDKQLQDAFKKLELGQNSQQLKIVDETFLEKYQKTKLQSESTLDNRMRHNKKFRKLHSESFNILDFTKPVLQVIVKKPTAKKIAFKIKHKRRENPKKKLSRLKKNILRIRAARRVLFNQENLEIPIENISVSNTPEISVESDKNSEIHSTLVEYLPEVQSNSQPTVRHSRNFRPYCDQFITDEIRTHSKAFLTKIFKFQERAHESNPIKAKANCRYKVGIKEVLRLLEAKKVKFLLIAPDLEPNNGPGGIDEHIETMKRLATEQQIPCVFSLKRRLIGYILLKKVPIACVGILSFDGAETEVRELMKMVDEEKINYKNAAKS